MAGAEGLEPSTKVLETHVLPLCISCCIMIRTLLPKQPVTSVFCSSYCIFYHVLFILQEVSTKVQKTHVKSASPGLFDNNGFFLLTPYKVYSYLFITARKCAFIPSTTSGGETMVT